MDIKYDDITQKLSNLIDSQEFKQLESLINEFNIFTTLGIDKAELKHSNFLAYLLDPKRNHGLEDFFLKKLLIRTISNPQIIKTSIRPDDIEKWNIKRSYVKREDENIDILVVNEQNKFIIIIENKIRSKDDGKQLSTYYNRMKARFDGVPIIGIYLTPEGDIPNEETGKYEPIGYEAIFKIIEEILSTQKILEGTDLFILLKHYLALRKYLMNDGDLKKLCAEIWRKHNDVLQVLIGNQPENSALGKYIKDLISNSKNFSLDDSSKTYIRFYPNEWNNIPSLKSGELTKSKQILLFGFEIKKKSIKLLLTIWPGEKQVREKIYQSIISSKCMLFNIKESSSFGSGRKRICNFNIIKANKKNQNLFDDEELNNIKDEISTKWKKFLTEDYKELNSIIKGIKWKN
ncbi:MAG: PD-(D/E)XK nuclease family protein [Ignavibacteriales bacterium]|nr:PD-(D/E)XK nuclease family protein [Ignavibacteriales bacterium]